jgi:CheY-like chemotaxis protein
MTQQLVFKDDANGDILIEILQASRQASQQGESVLRFSGEQGFLRGTLRALARERKSRHLSPEAPFELALHQDGRLSITDTGCGMDVDTLAHIFEPFFTTKSRETATGLGLSMARSIVLTHGGAIKVCSSLHLGSAFEVYLPLAGASNGRTPRMDKKKPALSGGRPRVLLVDEDLESLGFFTSALNGLDYETTRANGPIEALARVAEYGKDLDLVITRQDLPATDGLSFLRVLKHMLPNVGVIATSGEANEVPKNEFQSPGGTVLLCKPFTQDALLKAIQQVSEKRNYGSST